MAEMTMAQALNEALRYSMKRDDRVIVMGEDVGLAGGVFRVTDKLQQEFGEERVIDTPLAESGIIGTGIGLAIYGFRPVCEMQFDGFTYPAFEQIISHLAKYRSRTMGKLPLSVVVRIPFGGGIGAVEHHSESLESYFTHTAGLKVVSPSTPSDAFALLVQAIEDPDPVIFLEPKRRYWIREEFDVPVGNALPRGKARIVREGTDVTLITYGPSVRTVEEAAAEASNDGVSCEVIDLRWLNPLDIDTIMASVRKTGRAVVVTEAPVTGSFAGELAARIAEDDFLSLNAPVLRVGGFDIPYPPAKVEDLHLPDLDRVLDAVDSVLNY
ncbi:MAG TPA: alpha-ketoacid dehydrogenase subunit beta [Actinomycetota bacterium]|nr:alpha-ketoacid dehydrogenase subunit beta [Actinomycetota bacterium]